MLGLLHNLYVKYFPCSVLQVSTTKSEILFRTTKYSILSMVAKHPCQGAALKLDNGHRNEENQELS